MATAAAPVFTYELNPEEVETLDWIVAEQQAAAAAANATAREVYNTRVAALPEGEPVPEFEPVAKAPANRDELMIAIAQETLRRYKRDKLEANKRERIEAIMKEGEALTNE